MEQTRELTPGEKLVGIKFNPSGNPDVDKAKQLCAELADLIINRESKDQLHAQLYNHAIGEILNAQMNVVKVLTF
jgi:hypothetical protein